MKKTVVILFFICLLAVLFTKNSNTYDFSNIVRYRIIANSNSTEDIKQKLDVNKDIIPLLSNIEKESNNKDEVRINTLKSIPQIENVVKKNTDDYFINYGNNYFPEKKYSNITIPEGNYESLVITLGDGKGDNWWCMLFPPLCLIEASNYDLENVTYTTYIEKIINKYL